MASLKLLIQNGEVCRRIRSRTLFFEAPPEEDDTGGPFWCAANQSSIGPDGGVVDATRCRAGVGRSCCETG